MTDKEIHERFVRFGAQAREAQRRCAELLPLVRAGRIWEKQGFSGIYEYAAKLAGMSRSAVDTALWVMKKVEDKPALQRVVREKGFHAVRPVANVATAEDAEFWAGKVREMSKHTLEVYVREHRKSCPGAKTQSAKLDVTLELKADLARRLEQVKKHAGFAEELEKLVKRLEGEAPEPVRSSRHIPAHIRRFVLERTGGKCAFPGCRRDYAILHHTQRWALDKVHDPQRLQPLCKAHERLAHLGLIENEEGPAHTWRIRREPDRTNYKFFVDQQVSLYRSAGGG